MPTESKSETPRMVNDTPRTNKAVIEISKSNFVGDKLDWITFARQLEKELNEANRHRMEDCATSLEQSSLVIKVTKERDELKEDRNTLAKQLEGMINGQEQDQKYIEELAKENKVMREALVKCFTYFGAQIKQKTLNQSASDGTQTVSREVAAILDNTQTLPNLLVLHRDEMEKLRCECKTEYGQVPEVLTCVRCQLIVKFGK